MGKIACTMQPGGGSESFLPTDQERPRMLAPCPRFDGPKSDLSDPVLPGFPHFYGRKGPDRSCGALLLVSRWFERGAPFRKSG